MSIVLFVALLGQNCGHRVQAIVRPQHVQAAVIETPLVQQTFVTTVPTQYVTPTAAIVTKQVITQEPVQALLFPQFVYAAGDSERLDKLERLIEQNTELNATNQKLLANQHELLQSFRAEAKQQTPAESPIAGKARALLKTNCLRCHGSSGPKGDLDLSGEIAIAQKLMIRDRVETKEFSEGRMPPKGEKELSAEEVEAIRAWVLEDRAAVRAYLKVKKEGASK